MSINTGSSTELLILLLAPLLTVYVHLRDVCESAWYDTVTMLPDNNYIVAIYLLLSFIASIGFL